MKNTEEYLAQILKAMEEFQHTEFTSSQHQDDCLSELLGLREKILKEMDDTCATTPNYWECECEDKYLHPKNEGPIGTFCIDCDCTHEASPDARISDVLRNLMKGEYLTDPFFTLK